MADRLPRLLLHAEGAAVAIAAVTLYFHEGFDWWLLLLGLLPLALPGPRKRRPARVRGLARRTSPLPEWQHATVSAVRCDRRRRRQNFPQ